MNGVNDYIVAISKFGVPAVIALYLVYKLGVAIDTLVVSQIKIITLLETLIRLH